MPTLKVTDGKVSPQKFNALVEYVNTLRLNPGVGYLVSRNRGGTVIQTKPGKGGVVTPCPFDIQLAPIDGSDSTLTMTLRPGTVNSLLPDNIFDEFTVTISDVTKVKARATSDGNSITSVTLIVDTDEPEIQVPTPGGLPTSVDILLAVVTGGKGYRIISCGSIFLSGMEQFRTDKSTPAEPGTLDYTPYFAWVAQ